MSRLRPAPRRSSRGAGGARVVAACCPILVAACGGDLGLDPDDIIGVNGTYEARTFEIVQDATPRDVLAEGGSLRVVLLTDFLTSGRLVVPGGVSGQDPDLDVDLAGTWAVDLEELSLRFSFDRDVFLEDLEFDVSRRRLAAERVVEGVAYMIVLVQVAG